MTDITRKLELLANLKAGDDWPAELGKEFGAVSAICAKALVEIQWLKRELKDYIVKDGKAMAEIRRLSVQHIWSQHSSPMIYTAPMSGRFVPEVGGFLPIYPQTSSAHEPAPVDRALSGKTATQVIIDDPHEPAPEPWGSSFAMNTENWK